VLHFFCSCHDDIVYYACKAAYIKHSGRRSLRYCGRFLPVMEEEVWESAERREESVLRYLNTAVGAESDLRPLLCLLWRMADRKPAVGGMHFPAIHSLSVPATEYLILPLLPALEGRSEEEACGASLTVLSHDKMWRALFSRRRLLTAIGIWAAPACSERWGEGGELCSWAQSRALPRASGKAAFLCLFLAPICRACLLSREEALLLWACLAEMLIEMLPPPHRWEALRLKSSFHS